MGRIIFIKDFPISVDFHERPKSKIYQSVIVEEFPTETLDN